MKPRFITTPVFDTYWQFAAKRQSIFFKRLRGEASPWTDDPTLLAHKFTNAYRAADRVSQFLIRHVIYKTGYSEEDTFFRILVFKLFNRIETWVHLERALGDVCWSGFSFERYAHVLSRAKSEGRKLYSSAYIMPSGKSTFGFAEKHRNHLRLIESMMRGGLPAQIIQAPSMAEAYYLLLAYPTIGPFLAYQLVTDINYSELTCFSEEEFVIAGPGARSGIRKCFLDRNGCSDEYLIQWVAEHQQQELDRRQLKLENLWGRPLQFIDCQNLFCETDKYARVTHPECNLPGSRTRIKQRFNPNSEPIDYWFPPKWGINEKILAGAGRTAPSRRGGAGVIKRCVRQVGKVV
jgi:hypothetical protein